MIRMGIIGAENSHTAAIARIINVDKLIKGVQVVALWGETEEFARKAAEAGQVPTIVARHEEMLGKVDALMVDHRHAKYHLPAAAPFLEARVPLFIDKPFSYRYAEGKAFLARARKLSVPVTSFSVLPEQKAFRKFQAQLAKAGELQTLVTTGPCDICSPYGGVFFYGIHQVGAILKLVGTDVKTAQLHAFKGADRHTATLEYGNGLVVTMNLIKGYKGGFHFLAACEKGVISYPQQSDPNPYLAGAKKFTTMFKTGKEPEAHDDILAVVKVLEALETSVKSGKREKV
ncbi:MAG: Gfo/Idh/MocA family oxidoreductase [Phycisphaerae bacterium]|nr:Gfo/Idh/MocA family oxidoreductase [Phycisphaerae bacterium]